MHPNGQGCSSRYREINLYDTPNAFKLFINDLTFGKEDGFFNMLDLSTMTYVRHANGHYVLQVDQQPMRESKEKQ
jgi:hypothetical protein